MILQVAKRIANIRFDRPCRFASQTFVCFANHPFKVFRFMQKNWFYYTLILHYTQEKHYSSIAAFLCQSYN